MNWNIKRKGRSWHGNEAREKFALTPQKIEMIEGKLFLSEEDRLNMLGLLMENIGLDQVLKVCDPATLQQVVNDIND